MQRRPTTQDITWLLDLRRNNQLDLDPPYQRRSVWTRKDRQFFLDTIFRNYPSPAIFLHKTMSDAGQATYHVVDGKQRTETILNFVDDKLRIAQDFGDIRLNGKKWSDLQGENDLRKRFWDYQVTVEMIDIGDSNLVNTVFDRLNRNSRNLKDQELRHAKFEGWFITEAEAEANREEWRVFGVVTPARAKRMGDVQFISELMLVVLEGRMLGFNQDRLDELYAKYDEPVEAVPEFDEDDFRTKVARVRDFLKAMEEHNQIVSRSSKALANFYTLWCFIAFNSKLPEPTTLAEKYKAFIGQMDILVNQKDLAEFLQANTESYSLPLKYLDNTRGASTDLAPREARYQALKQALLEP